MFNKIKQFFNNMQMKANMGQNLASITDHPWITSDDTDYANIRLWQMYWQGLFPKIKYLNTQGTERSRDYITLNMSARSTGYLSKLIFNEGVSISVDDDDSDDNSDDINDTQIDSDSDDDSQPQTANDLIQQIFADNNFYDKFGDYLEAELAMGGLAIKPVWNPTTSKIELHYVLAPNFYPMDSDTKGINSACFSYPNYVTENGVKFTYTRLEFHYWTYQNITDDSGNTSLQRVYNVHNELYKAYTSSGELGKQIPLNTLPQYQDMQPDQSWTGIERPMFVYMKTSGLNKKNLNSPLGQSIFADAIGTLKSINDVYDQFNWDTQMSQKKVIVTANTQAPVYKDPQTGKLMEMPHMVFPENQNVFMSMPGDSDDPTIKDISLPIRAADYLTAIKGYLSVLEVDLGFSAGTFTFDGQAVQTATAVISENSTTYQTRQNELNGLTDGLRDLINSILEVYYINNPDTTLPTNVPDDAISIDFDDGVFQDRTTKAQFWNSLVSANEFSRQSFLMKVLGYTEEQAKAELALVDSENPVPSTDASLGGSDFDGNEEGVGDDTTNSSPAGSSSDNPDDSGSDSSSM